MSGSAHGVIVVPLVAGDGKVSSDESRTLVLVRL
jgi:hypothetical protein